MRIKLMFKLPTATKALSAAALLVGGTFASAQVRLTATGGGPQYVSLQAPATLGANINWILPPADGAANQCLITDGSQNLGWRGCTGNAFSLSADDGSPANALYVEAAGRVGIGITTPTTGVILDMAGSGTASSSVIVPRDTTANRPTTGVNGMIRYNSTTNSFEGYENGDWVNFARGLMGKVEIAPAALCTWPNAAGTTFANMAADTDCGAMTASYGATVPGSKIPAITINSLPPGDYEVTVIGQFSAGNLTGGQFCRWRLTDGTSFSGYAAANWVWENNNMMKGIFSYTTTANQTFQVQVGNPGGTAGLCTIQNTDTANGFKFEIWVRRI